MPFVIALIPSVTSLVSDRNYKVSQAALATMEQFAKAGPQISGPNGHTKEFHAGFLHEFNNLHEVYGENLEKLKSIKKKYDPTQDSMWDRQCYLNTCKRYAHVSDF